MVPLTVLRTRRRQTSSDRSDLCRIGPEPGLASPSAGKPVFSELECSLARKILGLRVQRTCACPQPRGLSVWLSSLTVGLRELQSGLVDCQSQSSESPDQESLVSEESA
jgi:hypothetical protein